MRHLIVTYGAKQSGKTTSITELYAFIMTQKGIIPGCVIDQAGKMFITYSDTEAVHFDIDDDHPDAVEFKKENVWPYIQHVSFADALKNAVINLFSIPRELVYGTDVQKNTPTHIKWANVLKFASPERYEKLVNKSEQYMTVRELLQFFGTDVCREFDEYCHIRSAFTKLINSDAEILCVPDGRFENEFEFFDLPEIKQILDEKNIQVTRVKFTKNIHPDNPPGEQGLPGISNDRYDCVFDNVNQTVIEKNLQFMSFLISRGIITPTGIARQT